MKEEGPRKVEPKSFKHAQPGDVVVRMLAGVLPMQLTVHEVRDGFVYCVGGWKFDAATGVEEDEELRWGVRYERTGSFLTELRPKE